jgi:hypothetical protein
MERIVLWADLRLYNHSSGTRPQMCLSIGYQIRKRGPTNEKYWTYRTQDFNRIGKGSPLADLRMEAMLAVVCCRVDRTIKAAQTPKAHHWICISQILAEL